MAKIKVQHHRGFIRSQSENNLEDRELGVNRNKKELIINDSESYYHYPSEESGYIHAIGDLKLNAGLYSNDEWIICDGAVLNVIDRPRLAAQLGSIYGGDGVDTFGIPDYRDKTPIGSGGDKVAGDTGGSDNVTLVSGNMPEHNHDLKVNNSQSSLDIPAGNYLAKTHLDSDSSKSYLSTAGTDEYLASDSITNSGSSTPTKVDIQNPYVTANFYIFAGE